LVDAAAPTLATSQDASALGTVQDASVSDAKADGGKR
jgi:hypothetical protein